MTDLSPLRGEIWWVGLDPTLGAEMSKTRPAVVLSSSGMAHVPLRIVVPVTSWQGQFQQHPNKVMLRPTATNGLRGVSAADVLQARSVSLVRFGQRLGQLDIESLTRVAATMALIIDWRPT